MTKSNQRQADHAINPLFLDRWSPRAFTGEDIEIEDLLSLFEAARWAPSSFNSQPWRFLYARRSSPHWTKFLGLLNEFNKSWAKDSSALVFVVSNPSFRRPGADVDDISYSASFDTGAAWACLALQAASMGLSVHGMIGFDMEQARNSLNVPETYRIEAAIAIGRKGDSSKLPEALAARETPNGRNEISSFVFEGGFKS